jgi:hypothetical protein
VGIGEANDLPGVAWVGENFLITGKAGIENNFAAPTRNSAGGATVKYAPIFEREDGRSVVNFGQEILRLTSFFIGLGRGQGTEMVHRPISKDGAAVDVLAGDSAKHA